MTITLNGATGETTPATAYTGSTSGTVTVQAPAVAGTNTLTLPAATDTLVGKATTDTLTNKTLTSPTITGALVSSMASTVITAATAQGSTTGTSVDFTSIPSWVKSVTIIFNGVSASGTDNIWVRVGSGSFSTSGYSSQAASQAGAFTTGATSFVCSTNMAATSLIFGSVTLSNISGNNWVQTGTIQDTGNSKATYSAGAISLSGALDRVQVLTAGTNTFDTGVINIFYQ